ncbi:hypothetical protein ABH944_006232 [Caballeronia udeis]|uniref:HTH-type transcriptional regulator AraC-type N-terminal domain-containing protein n=1 Tax=Caballeronia udeis TaxID=1232866 RepID=A0ABW8MQY5_9BURK
MTSPQATVPISLVNGFLAGVNAGKASIDRFVARAGIAQSLLGKRGARVTQLQFAALYRMLAVELDDEMAGIFSRPLRNGLLKYLCLSLLDAPRLEVAMHRFGQFFHLVLDDVDIESSMADDRAPIAVLRPHGGPEISVLGMELMLKLAHGIASWLVAQRIPLLHVEFDFPRPAHAGDYLYLFPRPVLFDCAQTSMHFDAITSDCRSVSASRIYGCFSRAHQRTGFSRHSAIRLQATGYACISSRSCPRSPPSTWSRKHCITPGERWLAAFAQKERLSRPSRTSCAAILRSNG